MEWLEVSMIVDGELAEAVADVLARFAPGGVAAEQGIKFLDEDDLGTAAGPITVRAYLPMDARIEETRRRVEEALYYLGTIQPLPAPSFAPVADQNWMEAWKQHYRPIPIGTRLMVVPAWLEPEGDRIPIKIDPGMAFGTGTHPSTRLCLELMEKCFVEMGAAALPRMIDVGCGSGILSIAALKLGARTALGVDIDAGSIENARANARTNGIGPELILEQGSVQDILAGGFPFRSAPLVAANILAPVIRRMLEAGLAELVEAGGVILLSGILDEQAQAVLESAQSRGLRSRTRLQMGDWVALAMER